MTQAITGFEAGLMACRGVLVDSDVLLDVATNDRDWGAWSARALAEVTEPKHHTDHQSIVYAEVSIEYTTIEALGAAIPATVYRREPLPWEAGFLAGKSFLLYRRRGGLRTSPLPDFYIGAHAAIGRLQSLEFDFLGGNAIRS